MALSEKDKTAYLNGLRRFRAQGVSILVDGARTDEKEWSRILTVSEDSSFYMGDYIEEASSGRLKEIRFNKVSKGGSRNYRKNVERPL